MKPTMWACLSIEYEDVDTLENCVYEIYYFTNELERDKVYDYLEDKRSELNCPDDIDDLVEKYAKEYNIIYLTDNDDFMQPHHIDTETFEW